MESKTSKSMGEKVFIGGLLGCAGAFILMCMIFGSFLKSLSDAQYPLFLSLAPELLLG